LNVIFTSTPSGICTVSGTNGATITAAHVGTCTIAANQAGNSTFAAAPQVTQDVSVGKGSQTISNLSFSTTNLAPNGTTTVNATNSSILPVTFASATAPICTVSGNTVTAAAGVTSGTCYITARQDGNTDYLEATPRGLNISVGITQTIGSLSLTPNLRVGITSTVSAPITSGLTISFNSLTPSKCTVSGSTVTGVAVGTCTLSADQFGNATYAPAAQVKQNFVVAAATGNSSSLTNISTRGPVQTGNNVMIGGFIISGSTPKTVLVRARGPSLTAFGVANPVANPTVSLYSGTTVIASNDNWASPVTVAGGSAPASQAAIQATLQAPTNSLESAILTTLPPGTYTAIMSGVGGTGVGIVEVLEIDHPESPLINISTRGPVQTGDNVMIGGFVINGSTPQTVLITARGPSLASAGLTGLLANPTMNLYSGTTVIASNDNWATPVAVAGGSAPASQAAIQATGQAPTYPLESAILTTLQPGSYTVIVQGVGNTTGLAIVEVNAQ
jgi:hypothetical protein